MATNARRGRRSRAQWQLLIERAGRSPLSVAAFCQAEGISSASFYAWRKWIAGSVPQAATVADCEPPASEPLAAVVASVPGKAAPFLDL